MLVGVRIQFTYWYKQLLVSVNTIWLWILSIASNSGEGSVLYDYTYNVCGEIRVFYQHARRPTDLSVNIDY